MIHSATKIGPFQPECSDASKCVAAEPEHRAAGKFDWLFRGEVDIDLCKDFLHSLVVRSNIDGASNSVVMLRHQQSELWIGEHRRHNLTRSFALAHQLVKQMG